MQAVVNTTTPLWYGTSDILERGKMLMCAGNPEIAAPPFAVVHPDDVPLLPAGARHLREYRPTMAELARIRPIIRFDGGSDDCP